VPTWLVPATLVPMEPDKQIKFRASGTEKTRIEAFAKDQGYQFGEYLKLAALELVPDPEVPGDVVPTPEEAAALHRQIEAEVAGEAEAPTPDLESRETFLRFLYERNTELHRDKQKCWPGVKARRRAGEDWKLVREGKPLEKVEPRKIENALVVTPTTYRMT